MSSITSYTSFDYNSIQLIPVIASFTSDGHIAPLFVRIQGEALKVDSFWIKCNFSNRTEFNCQLQDHGLLRPVLLTYYHTEGVWGIHDTS